MEKQMDEGLLSTVKVKDIRVNDKMIFKMDMELKVEAMDKFMKVSIKMRKKQVKER